MSAAPERTDVPVPSDLDPKFLTVLEVATVLRVSKMTVYRICKSGELDSIRVGRSYRIPEQGARDYMSRGQRVNAETPEQGTAVIRWRKKPVTVEAIQWTGGNLDEVRALTGRERFDALNEQQRANCDDPDATAEVYDKLHSTWVLVFDGQWIIKGVRGEFYPIADDVLRETYEAADGAPKPGQVPEIPDAYARYIRATFPPEIDVTREIPGRWKHLTGPAEREFWRSLDAAQEPKPAPELAEVERKLSITLNALQRIDRTRRTVVDQAALWDIAQEAIDKVTDVDGQLPQPAPELAAAMAESRMLRDSLAEALAIARELPPSTRSAELARNRNLSAIAKRAGLPS